MPAWHMLVVALLALAHALPYGFSTVILDTTRDLTAAIAILEGAELPLRGPVINAMAHLGPLWFYLLAAVLAFTDSIGLTLTMVGVLAAAQFPLAYGLGSRLQDRRFGLLFALALALPGWADLAQVLVSHTSVIASAMLVGGWCLLRVARDGRRWWVAFGLAQSLALHAHPATLLLVVPAAWVLWRRRPLLAADAPWLLLGMLAALVPFLPMLWAEWSEGLPALAPVTAFLETAPAQGFVSRFGGLLAAAWHSGPVLAVGVASGDSAWVLATALALCALAAATGLLLGLVQSRTRTRVLLLFGGALATLALLTVLRELTPYYMLLAWLPFQALLLAMGWHALPRRATALLVAVALGAALLGDWHLVRRAEQGLAALPSAALGDVKRRGAAAGLSESALLPAWRLDQAARRLCASAGPVVLHADLGLLLDNGLGPALRMRCPQRLAAIHVGGGAHVADATHWLGLTPRLLRRIGRTGAGWELAFSLVPERVVAPATTVPLAPGSGYPLRQPVAGAPREWQRAFVTADEAIVVLSRPFWVYDRTLLQDVSVDGQAPEQLFQTSASAAYRAPRRDSQPNQWVVRWQGPLRDGLEILVAPPAPDRVPAGIAVSRAR